MQPWNLASLQTCFLPSSCPITLRLKHSMSESWRSGEIMVSHRLDPLELELQEVVCHLAWMLGLKLRSSAKAAGTVNHWAITLAP